MRSSLRSLKGALPLMRKSIIEYVHVGRLDLPRELADDVKLLLLDPLTGRTRYGELRRISTMLWSNWVEAQRSGTTQPETLLQETP